MTISEKIYQLRVDRQLSQSEFAQEIGVDRPTVARWEVGIVDPSVSQLRVLCKRFGLDANAFISDVDNLSGTTVDEVSAPEPVEITEMDLNVREVEKANAAREAENAAAIAPTIIRVPVEDPRFLSGVRAFVVTIVSVVALLLAASVAGLVWAMVAQKNIHEALFSVTLAHLVILVCALAILVLVGLIVFFVTLRPKTTEEEQK